MAWPWFVLGTAASEIARGTAWAWLCLWAQRRRCHGFAMVRLWARRRDRHHGGTAWPASLKKLVAASLLQQPRIALFVSPQTGLSFATETVFTNGANRTLKALFGKPVTCNIARHAYCSALDTARMSTSKLEEIGRLLGHSLGHQRACHRVDEPRLRRPSQNADGEYTVPVRIAVLPPSTTDLTADIEFPAVSSVPCTPAVRAGPA